MSAVVDSQTGISLLVDLRPCACYEGLPAFSVCSNSIIRQLYNTSTLAQLKVVNKNVG